MSASVAELHSQAESVCVVVWPVVLVVVAGRSSSSVWCPVLANVQRALETRKVENGAEDILVYGNKFLLCAQCGEFPTFFNALFQLI